MSFDPAKLALLAHANDFTLLYYETEDEADQLVAPGYFHIASRMLRRGDFIFSSCLMSGARKTGLFLVTTVTDEHVSVEALQSATANDLSNLRDVAIKGAETGQVLSFDRGVWVNQQNPGAAGDAHARETGNPHRTTAAETGAVSLSEKGQPFGVAVLDATGRVLPAQLPPLDGVITSVFGRTGAVAAATGDYSPAQVGAPPVARKITTTGSLKGGGDLSADRAIALVGDATSPGDSKYYGTNAGGAKGFYDIPAAAVSSVFGRTGVVAAQPGDYTAAQVGAVPATEKGEANGVATLDAATKLTASQLPTHTHAIADVTGLQTALDARASVREAKVAAYTAATSGVGLDESVVVGKATSAITLTLTTNTGMAKKLSVTNRGTAPLTIAAGSGQTIRGGSLVLQPASEALTPSSVCLVRDPSDNAWLVI
jgi:hypothetical protein